MESSNLEQDYQQLVDLGNNLLGEKDYENAIQAFGEAMQIQVEKHGDLDKNCAHIYFLYGKAMVENYRENSGLFSEKVKIGHTEQPFHLKPEQNPSVVSSDSEELDDLQIAWENLDTSRLILEKYHDDFSRNILADVYLYLGIIEFESGREDNACLELTKSVEILKDFKDVDPQHFAHAFSLMLKFSAFELGLAYNLRSLFNEAISFFEMSKSTLEEYKEKLKKGQQNIDKITGLENILEELNEKIRDCMSCLNNPIVETDQKSTDGKPHESGTDISHLVKRKSEKVEIKEEKRLIK